MCDVHYLCVCHDKTCLYWKQKWVSCSKLSDLGKYVPGMI